MQSSPDLVHPARSPVWRIALAYILGCVLAGIWVTYWLGGAILTVDLDTYEPIETGWRDAVGTWVLTTMIALVGCFIPVTIGRGLMLWRGVTWPAAFALIWGLAGVVVAGGPNLASWTDAELWTAFFLPGCVIGLVVWWADTGGRR